MEEISERSNYNAHVCIGANAVQSIGYLYEQDAVDLIENHGLEVLCRNFRRKTGEIDIIALDREHLVFVEVRSRSNRRFASAMASVRRSTANWGVR